MTDDLLDAIFAFFGEDEPTSEQLTALKMYGRPTVDDLSDVADSHDGKDANETYCRKVSRAARDFFDDPDEYLKTLSDNNPRKAVLTELAGVLKAATSTAPPPGAHQPQPAPGAPPSAPPPGTAPASASSTASTSAPPVTGSGNPMLNGNVRAPQSEKETIRTSTPSGPSSSTTGHDGYDEPDDRDKRNSRSNRSDRGDRRHDRDERDHNNRDLDEVRSRPPPPVPKTSHELAAERWFTTGKSPVTAAMKSAAFADKRWPGFVKGTIMAVEQLSSPAPSEKKQGEAAIETLHRFVIAYKHGTYGWGMVAMGPMLLQLLADVKAGLHKTNPAEFDRRYVKS